MGSLSKFLLGRDDFKSETEILQIIQQSEEFAPQREDIENAEALLIFQTSTQQTWLVATNRRLYCVLDDLSKSFTRVQWSMPAEMLVRNGEVTIPIVTHERSRGRTDRSGLVDIGERRNWLFSKKLFTTDRIEEKIDELIVGHMT